MLGHPLESSRTIYIPVWMIFPTTFLIFTKNHWAGTQTSPRTHWQVGTRKFTWCQLLTTCGLGGWLWTRLGVEGMRKEERKIWFIRSWNLLRYWKFVLLEKLSRAIAITNKYFSKNHFLFIVVVLNFWVAGRKMLLFLFIEIYRPTYLAWICSNATDLVVWEHLP